MQTTCVSYASKYCHPHLLVEAQRSSPLAMQSRQQFPQSRVSLKPVGSSMDCVQIDSSTIPYRIRSMSHPPFYVYKKAPSRDGCATTYALARPEHKVTGEVSKVDTCSDMTTSGTCGDQHPLTPCFSRHTYCRSIPTSTPDAVLSFD